MIKTNPLKLGVQQLQSDQPSNPLKFSQGGLQKLNESILALRKSALAVPFVQVNLLDSKILSEGAAVQEMQRMLGDIKLVSCSTCTRSQGRPLNISLVACGLAGSSLRCCVAVCACDRQADAELLDRGSRDGWTYADWKTKCSGQSNTLTLIKVSRQSRMAACAQAKQL